MFSLVISVLLCALRTKLLRVVRVSPPLCSGRSSALVSVLEHNPPSISLFLRDIRYLGARDCTCYTACEMLAFCLLNTPYSKTDLLLLHAPS